MTYHDLSPDLQDKVRANTISEYAKDGETIEDASSYLQSCIDYKHPLIYFFIFRDSPEGEDYWWDVMDGKIK